MFTFNIEGMGPAGKILGLIGFFVLNVCVWMGISWAMSHQAAFRGIPALSFCEAAMFQLALNGIGSALAKK